LWLLFCAAPAGKTRSSVPSPTGATSPAQLAAVIQFASPPPPSQVNAAKRTRPSRDSIARRRPRAPRRKEGIRRPCRELLPIREVLFTAGARIAARERARASRSSAANSTGGTVCDISDVPLGSVQCFVRRELVCADRLV